MVIGPSYSFSLPSYETHKNCIETMKIIKFPFIHVFVAIIAFSILLRLLWDVCVFHFFADKIDFIDRNLVTPVFIDK